MSGPGTPMLFLPPHPPVPLPPGGSLVIGRSRSCDLTLPSPDASRRHAEVVRGDSGFVLRDLGSTNGTLVNGLRVDERPLAPGDRIEIGGDLLTFCEVDPALDASARTEDGEAKTMLTRPALGACVRGSLEEIPPFAVLQMLEMGRKTGVLTVETSAGASFLWFSHGAPVHAETAQQRGFDAALTVTLMTAGAFSFEPDRTEPERTIEASVTELLLEASRQLDEASATGTRVLKDPAPSTC